MALAADLIDNFRKHLVTTGKLPDTCAAYVRDVEAFAGYCGEIDLAAGKVEPSTLVHYQRSLAEEGLKPNSIRRRVIAIRQFYRFLDMAGHFHRPGFDAVVIPGRDEVSPRSLTDADLRRLLQYASRSPHKLKRYRDIAALHLLGYEGIKASEIIRLRWADYLDHGGFGSVRIIGTKARMIHIGTVSNGAIKRYKERYRRSTIPQDDSPRHMFVSFRGRDFQRVVPRLSRHGLKFMLYELGQKVGIPDMHTELLRHHAIAHQLRNGKSPAEVMDHLGLKRLGNITKHVKQVEPSN